ncbi:ATPase complex subunit 9 [Botryosphaeria dothidea]|uniref:ATP synthase subunit 9, mitochondrial n=1 Tax=Botryosphaeria dothidea TaxID=55169 RepID=A0A8H4N875_9PEZI|nr:putative ATP synthase subunit protein [Botryosphaeria dothidea]
MAAARVTPKMATLTRAARPVFRAPVQQRAFTVASPAVKRATPFQAVKRQQPSAILRAAQFNKQTARPYSSEMANALVQVSQNLGMGNAAIGLGGAGIGIGVVFGALILAVGRNPSMRGQLFSYAILGFAFVEAIGLFDLMVAMMAKFV